MILAIKTDQPKAKLFLVSQHNKIIADYSYDAGRNLADTLLEKIDSFLKTQKLNFSDLTGICIFSGEGSFTGLRIGSSIANALAYSLNIKVIKTSGKDWLKNLNKKLAKVSIGAYVVPDYAKPPNITKPK